MHQIMVEYKSKRTNVTNNKLCCFFYYITSL